MEETPKNIEPPTQPVKRPLTARQLAHLKNLAIKNRETVAAGKQALKAKINPQKEESPKDEPFQIEEPRKQTSGSSPNVLAIAGVVVLAAAAAYYTLQTLNEKPERKKTAKSQTPEPLNPPNNIDIYSFNSGTY